MDGKGGGSMKDDTISRAAAIDAMINSRSNADVTLVPGSYTNGWRDGRKLLLDELLQVVFELPSAQPEQTDCEYCHEDSDGFVRPIEKNSHAWLVRRGRTMKLHISFKGEYRECDVLFCPMCGRGFGNG